MPFLELKNINKYFYLSGYFRSTRVTALNNISFSIKQNEIFGITGFNSSGKTVLSNIIVGLMESDSGSILFEDKELFYGDYLYRRSIIRMVTHNYEEIFNYDLSAYDILTDLLKMIKIDIDVIEEKISNVLSLIKFPQFDKHISFGKLNQLNKIRLAFSYALILTPKILVIDDLLSHLDITVQVHIINLMLHLKDKGFTIILTITDLGIINHICDSVLVLNHGEIADYGNTKKVLFNSSDVYTKRIVQAYFQVNNR